MAQDSAREVFPVTFYGKDAPVGKDFAIRPVSADFIEESDLPEAETGVEGVDADPKASSATASAEFSDLTPTTDAVVSEEDLVDAEKAPAPTTATSDASKQASSDPATTSGGSETQPVVPTPVTTPTSGSQPKALERSSVPTPLAPSASPAQ